MATPKAGQARLAIQSKSLKIHPLTPDRWEDFKELFGTSGAYGGCWCMWWRIKRSEFERNHSDGNKRAIRKIIRSGNVPGILAYQGSRPIAWCSVAPREDYPSINRSHVLKPIDEKPVWSIPCFFVKKEYRGQGVVRALLEGAIRHVRSKRGKILEAYPTIPRAEKLPPVSSYMGIPSVFQRAGFVECARPSKSRMIMRYYIKRGAKRM